MKPNETTIIELVGEELELPVPLGEGICIGRGWHPDDAVDLEPAPPAEEQE